MSDPTGSTDTVKREAKPRNVSYELEIVDDLPEYEITRRSPLEDALDSIREKAEYHDKWVRIGSYDKGTAASAASNVMRQRHGGSAAVEGFVFQAKRYDEVAEDGSKTPKTGLFVKFAPNQIVPGARNAWDKSEIARIAKINDKRKAEGKEPLALPKHLAAGNGDVPAPAPKPGTPAQDTAPGSQTGAGKTEPAKK